MEFAVIGGLRDISSVALQALGKVRYGLLKLRGSLSCSNVRSIFMQDLKVNDLLNKENV